jgi:hypothetical protein
MAGSLKFFVYTSDAGPQYALKRDESNVEAVNGAVGDYPDSGSTVDLELPRNIKPRYATYVSTDGTVRRNIVVLTPALYAGLAGTTPTIVDDTSGLTLTLKTQVGEQRTLPFGADTGLIDGDAT